MAKDRRLLFLAPQLYGAPGGVPMYMRRLREILALYGEQFDCQLHACSLVDNQEEPHLHPRSIHTGTFTGCRGKKPAFVLTALRAAGWRGENTAIVGHVNQGPAAWLLHKCGLLHSYILVLHGIEAWGRMSAVNRLAAQHATCVVATTQYTGQEFCRHNDLPDDRIRVIPLALADEHIAQQQESPAAGEHLSVLTVGRLWSEERYKGTDTLIEAVAHARERGGQIHLNVVGDGDDLPRLKNIATERGVAGQVSFLGSVHDDRLQELYQSCDVFALPSKGEGFGIVFLEAMRYGKPCIGGNHGGTPEVIQHGQDGYLVD